jgi:hypothetical protein
MTRFIDRLARSLHRPAADEGRRSLLKRAAVTGTALVVAPKDYALKPLSAYAAVCSCSGSSCDCSSLCCDGYTEFCCTLNGVNWCPTGAVTGGWWKVDSSSYCASGGVARPRYYLDCHNRCGSCGCTGGVCSGACSGTHCGCANGSCANRKAGCTRFRYGQCNAGIPCLGPIVCRVVTCTPPWQIDAACSSATLTDNNTRWHHRPCLEQPYGPFPDVPPGRYYSSAVLWAHQESITTGVGDTGLFKPLNTVNRAQAITMLWRMMDQPRASKRHSFPDVPSGSYYDRAVSWGVETGVTDGYWDTGQYRPAMAVTRAQAVTMLWRMVGQPTPSRRQSFPDVPRGSWFETAVSWAVQHGITTGMGDTGRFAPHTNLDRAQMVTFLWRLAGKKAAWYDTPPPSTVRF